MSLFGRRAIQLDLARQIETLPTVFRNFRNAHDSGMNMVVLYLEDRIKTESYPYSPDEESYSPDEIREMVAYAETLGLELVPVVSPIGHTERFLRHKELQHLAELNGGCAGRFNETKNSTCATLPETYTFFDRYLREVAALFPSKFFHIGFDEIEDLGLCDRCRREFVDEHGIGALFLKSLLHFYELLKSLGKTVMMWDDMLDWHPEVLDSLPKDIILCPWWYEHVGRYPYAHMKNSARHDALAYYEKKGFSYFVCARDTVVSLDSLTAYAAKRKPFGVLMTSWRSTTKQINIFEPMARYAGLLWDNGLPAGAETLRLAMKPFAGSDEGAAVLAETATLLFRAIPVPKKDGGVQQIPWRLQEQDVTAEYLEKQLEHMNAADADCRNAYLSEVRRFRLSYRLQKAAFAMHEYRTGESVPDMARLRAELSECRVYAEQLKAFDEALWQRCRPQLEAPFLQEYYRAVFEALAWMEALAKTAKPNEIGRMDVNFFLPEYTAASITCITLNYADGTHVQVAKGNFKSIIVCDILYAISFPVPVSPVPESVTVTVHGYGAVGFCYMDVTLPQGKFLPDLVEPIEGTVEHPEHILENDSRFMLLNDQDMMCGVRDIGAACQEHKVTILLRKE